MVLVFYVLLCVALCQFYFCNHLNGEDRVGCFALFVFLVSRDCCVALPPDATEFSAVCDYGITFSHTHLLFCNHFAKGSERYYFRYYQRTNLRYSSISYTHITQMTMETLLYKHLRIMIPFTM